MMSITAEPLKGGKRRVESLLEACAFVIDELFYTYPCCRMGHVEIMRQCELGMRNHR